MPIANVSLPCVRSSKNAEAETGGNSSLLTHCRHLVGIACTSFLEGLKRGGRDVFALFSSCLFLSECHCLQEIIVSKQHLAAW